MSPVERGSGRQDRRGAGLLYQRWASLGGWQGLPGRPGLSGPSSLIGQDGPAVGIGLSSYPHEGHRTGATGNPNSSSRHLSVPTPGRRSSFEGPGSRHSLPLDTQQGRTLGQPWEQVDRTQAPPSPLLWHQVRSGPWQRPRDRRPSRESRASPQGTEQHPTSLQGPPHTVVEATRRPALGPRLRPPRRRESEPAAEQTCCLCKTSTCVLHVPPWMLKPPDVYLRPRKETEADPGETPAFTGPRADGTFSAPYSGRSGGSGGRRRVLQGPAAATGRTASRA